MKYSKSNLRALALLPALPIAMLGVTASSTNSLSAWIAHGPIQEGHSKVDCQECHQPSHGTIRQQMQANLLYALGLRENSVDFGYQKISSQQCLNCHERPNDRHPIYRFNEPRFSQARLELGANSCLGCHTEHKNERVSSSVTFCSSCHNELQLKDDPLDQPHAKLVNQDAWSTCLGCHDFHGNHTHKPQLLVDKAFDVQVIQAYLSDGPDPYGESKIFKAVSHD